jgi:hypothetical protein
VVGWRGMRMVSRIKKEVEKFFPDSDVVAMLKNDDVGDGTILVVINTPIVSYFSITRQQATGFKVRVKNYDVVILDLFHLAKLILKKNNLLSLVLLYSEDLFIAEEYDELFRDFKKLLFFALNHKAFLAEVADYGSDGDEVIKFLTANIYANFLEYGYMENFFENIREDAREFVIENDVEITKKFGKWKRKYVQHELDVVIKKIKLMKIF